MLVKNLLSSIWKFYRISPTSTTYRLSFNFSHKNQKKHFFKIEDGKVETAVKIIKPLQYPSNLNDETGMIVRERPIRYITPINQIPDEKLMSQEDVIIRKVYNEEWKSPQNSYTLKVGLIGPANAGKSELMNKLTKKLSAVSPKANTTTQIIKGVKSFEVESQEHIKKIQLTYFDTPGMMYNKTGFISKGWSVLSQIDFSLLVVDSAKRFDDMVKQSIKRLEKHRDYQGFMKALVFNKVDLVDNKRKFHTLIAEIEKYGKFDKIFYTSATTGYGVEQIQKYLQNMAKKGQWEYPKQVYTDRSEAQVVQEMLRQALFKRTYKEVPYKLLIQCVSFATKSNNVDVIQFKIMVPDQNQQRMLIGIGGKNIKAALDLTKVEYVKLFKKEAEIYASVKIKKNAEGRQQFSFEKAYFQNQEKDKVKLLEEHFQKTNRFFNK